MEEIKLLEKSIVEVLPQIPYVIDQVGEALKWAKEETDDGAYYNLLKKTLNVAEYAARVSENNFYKTHLVLATILKDIKGVLEDPKFARFDSMSKMTENSIKKITIDENTILERGPITALSVHLVPLAKEDPDLLNIMLYEILVNLQEVAAGMLKAGVKTPITERDYIEVLGYALVVSNLYMAKLNLLNESQVILNNIHIVLNNFNY